MKIRAIQTTAIVAAIGLAVGMPLVASADSSSGVWSGDAAAPVPHIPSTFNGSPTNDDPNTGQFTMTFDSTGRLVAVGRAQEPPTVLETSYANGRAQGSISRGTFGDTAASAATFANFRAQLKTLSRQGTAQTAQRLELL
jgi:hypothetical protein